jgi:hypothetical protein
MELKIHWQVPGVQELQEFRSSRMWEREGGHGAAKWDPPTHSATPELLQLLTPDS